MLQQTQVDRVAPKYRAFLKAFPTARALSSAPLSEVLRAWSGLGYNRRAKYLHEAAKCIARDFRGDMRKALGGPLPGVGPYTRAAVRIFAWDEPHTLLETNIRSVFIHHFFEDGAVHDRDLIPLIEQAAEGQDPRRWHWALMDYGAHIKKAFPNPSRRSAQYAKPSKFEGSLRQVRGAILKAHTSGESFAGVRERFADRFDAALASLVRDGLMERCAEGYPR